MRRRLPLRLFLSVVLGLCPPLVAGSLRAKEGCVVELGPKDANPAWRKVVKAADKRLAASDARAECKSVVVEVGEDHHARLTFTLVDGRSATRTLGGPEDLLPVLDALLVSLPAEPPPSPSSLASAPVASASVASAPVASASAPAPAVSPTPAPSVSPPSPSSAPPSPPSAATPRAPLPIRGVFGASLGARTGLDSDWFAPTVNARLGLLLFGFELGARGEWVPTSSPLGTGTPSGYSTYAGSAALSLGRREAWGRFEVPYGVYGGIGGTHEQLDTYVVDTFETHAGAHVAMARLLSERTRLHLGLVFDTLLSGSRKKATDKRELPAVPHFTLGLQVGLDVMP